LGASSSICTRALMIDSSTFSGTDIRPLRATASSWICAALRTSSGL
jgi:hypothetical protein